jgi:mono/diheme cytochrome c family protein
MKALLILIGLLVIIVAGVAGFFFLGYYNVAAAIDDPAIVTWALPKVRNASIDRHSAGLTPPMSLDDPAVIQDGARTFAKAGCINCHGGPGANPIMWTKWSDAMHPGATDLRDVAGYEPRQIFWVIKNGINMTAMPSFGKAGVSDKDIWAITAFVKKFASVKSEDFEAWTTAQ